MAPIVYIDRTPSTASGSFSSVSERHRPANPGELLKGERMWIACGIMMALVPFASTPGDSEPLSDYLGLPLVYRNCRELQGRDSATVSVSAQGCVTAVIQHLLTSGAALEVERLCDLLVLWFLVGKDDKLEIIVAYNGNGTIRSVKTRRPEGLVLQRSIKVKGNQTYKLTMELDGESIDNATSPPTATFNILVTLTVMSELDKWGSSFLLGEKFSSSGRANTHYSYNLFSGRFYRRRGAK